MDKNQRILFLSDRSAYLKKKFITKKMKLV